METNVLASAFRRARSEPLPIGDAELEARLVAVLEAIAPRTWVPAEAFAAFLGERIRDTTRIAEAPLADLYLVCACLRRSEEALAAFARLHAAATDAAFRRFSLAPDQVEELRGRLLSRLIVPGDTGSAPVLEQYRGEGALGAWLRVVAIREGLTFLRGRAGESLAPDAEPHAPREENLELSFVREDCRAAFKSAFGQAVAELSARERTLLKQHYLDGLSAREIARVRRVHHGTVARWLEDARATVFKRTRAALREILNVDGDELESMIRMLQSQWDITVGRFLAPSGSASAGR